MKTLLAVLLLVPAVLGPAFAQEAAGKPSTAQQDFTKDAYVIEQLSSRITAESDGTGTREVTAQVKVLAEAGVKAFAVLSFVYTSWNEVVEFDYVRVLKPDGTVVKTPDYNIQDMPGDVTRTAPLYSDVHEKHVTVKGLGVGDTLEYLVRIRIIKPEVPGQFWYEYEFTDKSIIKDERLELNVPADKYVKVVSPNYKPELKTEGGRRIYSWTHSNLVVKEKDPDEIPRRIPPNPDVQITTFASWEDVGRWYGGLQKEPLAVTPAIQAKAAELTKGVKTDDEKIHAIYNFVSLKFHYIGLDFGIGRYQPHAADDVLDNGYGDCKDKHTLLASLLKAAGYDAWPVLIHAHRKLDPDVPSPAQFNHVITVVPLNGSYIWLDTTPEVAPYRLLLLALRNKQALVIPFDQPAKLMTTPANPPKPQRQEFFMSGKLDSTGTFTGHANQSFQGDSEILMRMAFRQVPEAQFKELAQRLSQGMSFGGDVSQVQVTAPDDLDKPFEISYDYQRENYGDWENRHTTVALPPMGVEMSKDSKVKKPKEPMFIGAPGIIEYRSRVEMPKGVKIEPPKPVVVSRSFAEYKGFTEFSDGVMTTKRTLTIMKPEISLDDWEEYRTFGVAINEDEYGKTLELEMAVDDVDYDSQRATSNIAYDAGGAVKLLQKVIDARPDYPKAHLSLGIALVIQGKIDAALAEFHKEEELSPRDVSVYKTAAMNLVAAGRTEDAISEWRRLLKADPASSEAALSISQLQIAEGKNAEAVKGLEGAVKLGAENPQLQYALGSAYIKAGENQKALPPLQRAVELTPDDLMMMNNVAYTLAEGKISLDVAQHYAEQATRALEVQSIKQIDNAGESSRISAQLAMVWDTLGWIYFVNGDIERSEGFVRSAWLLWQQPVVGEHLGQIYEAKGKKTAAVEIYKLALAGISETPLIISRAAGAPPLLHRKNESNTLRHEITTRYQKLTGQKPVLNETTRLPNGNWTKTASEQLTQIRTVKYGKVPNLSGSGEFALVFSPGKVEKVEYVSGDQSLKPLIDKMKTSHYQIEFPPQSDARIFRKAQVGCFPLSGCMATLAPLGEVARQSIAASQN